MIEEVSLDAAAIKNIAFQLKGEVERLFLVLASSAQDKPTITVLIADEVVQEKGWNAGNMARQWAHHIPGGGVGQAFEI